MSYSESPILSVIMGVYNIAALPLFDHAVNSVLNQTIQNIEFIICDDGSTDETWEVLNIYARRDSRIRLIRSPQNEGLAAALNHCLEQAHGAFIARQDADDYSVSDRFQKQIEFMQMYPSLSFVGSNVMLWDVQRVWGMRALPSTPQAKDFLFTMPFVHGALMFRREALCQVKGYRMAKETRRSEDYDMLMRMYAAGMTGANLQECLYYFREDQAAMQRRKYRYRLDEAKVRFIGFQALGLMPMAIPYVIKPIIVGFIPGRLLNQLKVTLKKYVIFR